jgi:thiamine biosynthesis lipoprotein ApbE
MVSRYRQTTLVTKAFVTLRRYARVKAARRADKLAKDEMKENTFQMTFMQLSNDLDSLNKQNVSTIEVPPEQPSQSTETLNYSRVTSISQKLLFKEEPNF